jgi:leucyl/phenylalanyl-tRNA--protein transferase
MSKPELQLIQPGDPIHFNDVEMALNDSTDFEGLLAIGGDLSPARVAAAYRRGIFPWFSEGEEILWWAPNPRAVLLPAEFSCSRSLAKVLRKNRFQVSVNQSFDKVIGQCAALRANSGTWITEEMLMTYRQLHRQGAAHSVETWFDDKLVGGLYGIRIGSVFFGESMFSTVSDASKVALAMLVRLCEDSGIPLIDCQQPSAHLSRLGSRLIKRQRLSEILAENVDRQLANPDWSSPPRATGSWLVPE